MKTLLSMACLAPACLLASCVSGQTAPEVSPLVASSSPRLSVTDMPAAAAPAESASAVAVEPVEPAQTQTSTSYGPMAEDWELVIVGTGANSNDFDIGSFSVGANVGYFFSDRSEVGLRQSIGYSDFGDTLWNGSTRGFYDFHILTSSNLKPLIGVNIGYVYGENVDETWAAAPELGLKWYLTETAFLLGLVEYQFFFEDAEEADDTFSDGSFVYTLGIGVRL